MDGMSPVPKDGSLIKSSASPSVYYIYGGNKYLITSASAFIAYGFSWASIKTVPDAVVLGFSTKYSLDGVKPLPKTGLLIKGSTATVYYLCGSGKYPIARASAFVAYGFSWSSIKTLPDADISLFSDEYTLTGANPLPG